MAGVRVSQETRALHNIASARYDGSIEMLAVVGDVRSGGELFATNTSSDDVAMEYLITLDELGYESREFSAQYAVFTKTDAYIDSCVETTVRVWFGDCERLEQYPAVVQRGYVPRINSKGVQHVN